MRVLLIEDDRALARSIELMLKAAGFNVYLTDLGEDGVDLGKVYEYDMILLDLSLPDISGFEVLKQLRMSRVNTPVMILSGNPDIEAKVKTLGYGADDYLTKPFEMRELILRIRALARRAPRSTPPVHELAGIRLDPFRREVYRDGRYVALTRKQFAVLQVLVEAGGGVISAEELLERAWDENADPFTNAVRITVSALRKRLGEPWVILTVPGAGYRIDVDGARDATAAEDATLPERAGNA